MRLVCDASPLIILPKADLLRILPGLAERVAGELEKPDPMP
jgi:hypothetical protein